MNTENLSTLKIHKLTQAQYDREFAAGNIDATAFYLTPDEDVEENIEIPSNTCVVNVTGNTTNGYTADKTYDEILEAYNNGKTCYMYHALTIAGISLGTKIYTLYNLSSQKDLVFTSIDVGTGGVGRNIFQISSDNNILATNDNFTQVRIATENTNPSLITEDKTIVGAINEVNEKLEAKQPTEATELILKSPNGTRFSITVGDDGVLTATEIETV